MVIPTCLILKVGYNYQHRYIFYLPQFYDGGIIYVCILLTKNH